VWDGADVAAHEHVYCVLVAGSRAGERMRKSEEELENRGVRTYAACGRATKSR
jgi:hypothetical protein